MDINDLTIGQAKALAEMFHNQKSGSGCAPAPTKYFEQHKATPVVVCTDKRAVVFGYTNNYHARPISLRMARMCLYWEAKVGGVFGLADIGPTAGCKISATAPQIQLEGVTAVFSVSPEAERAWISAPVKGR